MHAEDVVQNFILTGDPDLAGSSRHQFRRHRALTGHEPSAAHKVAEAQGKNIADAQSKAQVVPAVGSGYLNEVSSLTVPSKPGGEREP